jgi:purine-cytosine permease-like protein
MSIADSLKLSKPTVRARFVSLIVVAIVATGIALAASGDFMAKFGDFLGVLLYLFTPWTAINLVDFYFVRKTEYSVREIFNPRGLYGRWNWRGLGAYFIGFAAMLPFSSTGFYVGPIARMLGNIDIGMVIGLVVSAAVYLVSCRSMDIRRELDLAREADRGIDSIL